MFEALGLCRELSLGILLKNPAWKKPFAVGILPGILNPYPPEVFLAGIFPADREPPERILFQPGNVIFPNFWREKSAWGFSRGGGRHLTMFLFNGRRNLVGIVSWGNQGKAGAGMKSCFNPPADAKNPSHIPTALYNQLFSLPVLHSALFWKFSLPLP